MSHYNKLPTLVKAAAIWGGSELEEGACVDIALCATSRAELNFCKHLKGNSFLSKSLVDNPYAFDKVSARIQQQQLCCVLLVL